MMTQAVPVLTGINPEQEAGLCALYRAATFKGKKNLILHKNKTHAREY